MSVSKPVRACLCYPHAFADLKALADAHGWTTVAEITREVGCGSGCGLCRPYLAKMLETGETPRRSDPRVSGTHTAVAGDHVGALVRTAATTANTSSASRTTTSTTGTITNSS